MDPLTAYEKAEIRALRLDNQAWSLELTRLEPAGNGIFHAISEIIEGPAEIVRVLDQLLARPDLAAHTRDLLARPSEDTRRLYQLSDQRWLPLPDASYMQQPERTRRDTAALEASLASLRELRNEALARGSAGGHAPEPDAGPQVRELQLRVEQLTATVEKLQTRIQALESEAPGGPPASPPGEMREADHRAAPAPEPFSLPAVDGDSEETAEADTEAAEPDDGSAPPLPVLPALGDLRATSEMLFGDELTIDEAPLENLPTKNAYIATLIDDQGATVGAVVSDVKALVSLGASMLLIPRGTWNELLAAPSNDVFDAMSEIVNNITPLLNKVDGNVHVRSTPLVPLDLNATSWLRDGQRVVFCESELEGHIAVVAAPRAIPTE